MMHLRFVLFLFALIAIILIGAGIAQAQSAKNPTELSFESPDHGHADITGYELDIIRTSDDVVIQTLQIPKSQVTPVEGTSPQRYRATLNVQPIAFGVYVGLVRAISTTVKSDSSTPSNEWERSPGAPSKPQLR